MWEKAKPLVITSQQRRRLSALARGRNTPQKAVLRALIVLGGAGGTSNSELAKTLGTTRPTILLWRSRFEQAGVEGLLQDAPRPGRKRRIAPQKVEAIARSTIKTVPTDATHWSVRSMARQHGVSPATVHRIWQAHGLQPHRVENFKLSTDPQFAEKVRDVVGLYLNPSDKALVLSVDEKSQIQALDRTQALLPLRPGIAARQTHDYIRHGTTTLFEALPVLDGKVIGCCKPRHRHTEFIEFLEYLDRHTSRKQERHLILDNYGTMNIRK